VTNDAGNILRAQPKASSRQLIKEVAGQPQARQLIKEVTVGCN
jgi:hypothetical protein